MTSNWKTRLVAFHEAGHAVADLRADFLPGRVTIVPDRDRGILGLCRSVYEDFDGTQLKDSVISLLAGYTATMECRRRWRLPCGRRESRREFLSASSDVEQARSLLGIAKTDIAELKPWLNQTRQFVVKEWRAITAVAGELIESQELNADEIQAIVDAVDETGRPDRIPTALAEAANELGIEVPASAAERPARFLRRAYLARIRAFHSTSPVVFTF